MTEPVELNKCLIVGLGNPGLQYEWTRHNLGFLVLKSFAEKQGWVFKKESRLKAELAKGIYRDRSVYLLLPATYMNLSGVAARLGIDYFRIPYKQEHSFLVVVDDVYLKLGEMRFRLKGSSGGHNGLKSIEAHLGQEYNRLRLGIDQLERQGALEDFVLGKWTKEEMALIPKVVDQAVLWLEDWLDQSKDKTLKQKEEQ